MPHDIHKNNTPPDNIVHDVKSPGQHKSYDFPVIWPSVIYKDQV